MKKTLYLTLLKSGIALIIFGITWILTDFYVSQNILIFVGALYLSVAWIKYLRKDKFLQKDKKINTPNNDVQTMVFKQDILSYLFPLLWIAIVGLI